MRQRRRIRALDDVFEDPEAIEDFLSDVREAFADYESPGLVVSEVDGSWYLSPIATGSEQLLAVVRSLTREEIQEFLLFFHSSSLSSLFWGGGGGGGVFFFFFLKKKKKKKKKIVLFLSFLSLFFLFSLSLSSLFSPPPPPPPTSGDYYSLPDEEFAATVADAAPCFEELVDSGEADELDLPAELLNPDCLLGRNWYATTDDDYLKEFEDCAFG